MTIFDSRICKLGEGPLWHPVREQLFWFDILGHRLLTNSADGPQEWDMGECVSAAGWVSDTDLIVASETGLFQFDLTNGESTHLCTIEADDPRTRSNDGRADPQGGFWIGTMARDPDANPRLGSFWRYYRGEVRRLFPKLSIPNACCFAPDGRTAYFSDTPTQRVMRVALDADGWPVGKPEVFLDLSADGLFPDGAVMDQAGVMWLAQWGAGRVAGYAPDGTLVTSVAFDAPQTTCPAFGGPEGRTLFCTSAQVGLDPVAHPNAGKTFHAPKVAQGQREHQVIL